MTNQMLLFMLRKTALFEGIPDSAIEQIAQFSERVIYEDGEKALMEYRDHPRSALYLLITGDVEVGSRFSPHQNARELAIAKVNEELYGEVSWLLGTTPSAGVTCKGRTTFIKIDGPSLEEFMTNHPEVAGEVLRRIARVLAVRLANLTQQFKMNNLFQM